MKDIQTVLENIDGSGSRDEMEAVRFLRIEYGKKLPDIFFELYKSAKRCDVRRSCIYYSIDYARESSMAVEMAICALNDKSKYVRYRACMLIAYSLNKSLLPILCGMKNIQCEDTREHIAAAIDAIENSNHNYFLDRKHTGRIFWS